MLDILSQILRIAPSEVGLLLLSGAFGAYARAVYMPEPSCKRRVLEGIAGALSALCLGGVVGHTIDKFVAAGPYAYLAAGFIMGEAGIGGARALRRRFLKEE